MRLSYYIAIYLLMKINPFQETKSIHCLDDIGEKEEYLAELQTLEMSEKYIKTTYIPPYQWLLEIGKKGAVSPCKTI